MDIQRLNTERLIIRRFEAEDWQDMLVYLSDPEVVKYEPYEVYTESECIQEALNRSIDEAFWAVCLKQNNKVIGNLYFNPQSFDAWELGYVFNRNYQGQGYASEAAHAMLAYGFHDLEARRIVAMCNPKNEPSWRLLERIGMRREGHLLENIFFKRDSHMQPIWVDTYEYGLLRSEWLNIKAHSNK